MNAPAAPVARLQNVTQRYKRAVALDDVTVALPGGGMVGLIGPDGVGKSTLLEHDCRCAAGAVGPRLRARRRHGGRSTPHRRVRPHRLHAAGAGQESLSRPQRSREHRVLRPPVRPIPRRTGMAHFRAPAQHRAGAVRRSSGEEAVGRHAAETRPVLLAHPRSGSLDPRRAHDRRRSAVAPSVLGTDRPYSPAPPGHERGHRHRLHGRGRAVRFAHRHERRENPRGGRAGGAEGADQGANGRGRIRRAAAAGEYPDGHKRA